MRRAQAGIENGRVSGRLSRVLVFRVAHGGRRRRGELAEEGAGSSCTGDHTLTRFATTTSEGRWARWEGVGRMNACRRSRGQLSAGSSVMLLGGPPSRCPFVQRALSTLPARPISQERQRASSLESLQSCTLARCCRRRGS